MPWKQFTGQQTAHSFGPLLSKVITHITYFRVSDLLDSGNQSDCLTYSALIVPIRSGQVATVLDFRKKKNFPFLKRCLH